jgi:hypothetical protein
MAVMKIETTLTGRGVIYSDDRDRQVVRDWQTAMIDKRSEVEERPTAEVNGQVEAHQVVLVAGVALDVDLERRCASCSAS